MYQHSVALISTSSDTMVIRPLEDAEAQDCEDILRSLPGWFGIEEAIVQYCHDIKVMDSFVVEMEGTVVGFATLKQHNPFTAEIVVMAVREDHHRSGIGRDLVKHVVQSLRSRGVEYIEVKTLGPSKPSQHYIQTRAFYEAVGFRPVEETNLWGEENPCLIMIKHLVAR